MQRTHSQLVGTEAWNPTGESMYSIVQRIRWQNCFNHREVSRFFVAKPQHEYYRDGWAHPDNPDYVHTDHLCELTQWDKAQLAYSHTAAYSPRFSGWRFGDPQISEPERLSLEPQNRVCPACAEQGVHLVFHQMSGWVGCPIHRLPLIDACPRCQATLGQHSYADKHCSHSVTRCAVCKWGSTQLYEVDIESRLRVLQEYGRWLRDIESAYDGNDASRIWLGKPDVRDQLPHIHALLPGPDWLDDCLEDFHRVRVSRHQHPALSLGSCDRHTDERLAEKQWCYGADTRFGPNDGAGLVCQLETRSQSLVSELNIQLHTQLHEHGQSGGRKRMGCERFIFSVSEHTLLTKTAWWLWRTYVGALLPLDQRYDAYYGVASRLADDKVDCDFVWPLPGWTDTDCHEYRYTYLNTFLGQHWIEGPGALVWGHSIDDASPLSNHALCVWADHHWRHFTLVEIYYAMVGLVGTVGVDTLSGDASVFEESLEAELREHMRWPLCIASSEGRGAMLSCASTMKDTDAFRRYIGSDRPGRQIEMRTDTALQDDLFELVGAMRATRERALKATEDRAYWSRSQVTC